MTDIIVKTAVRKAVTDCNVAANVYDDAMPRDRPISTTPNAEPKQTTRRPSKHAISDRTRGFCHSNRILR